MTGVSKAFDLSARFKPLVVNGVFDTLLFSDQYRRNVIFQGHNYGLETELAKLIRNLGAVSTYYYGEYSAKEPENIKTIEKAVRIVRDIEWRIEEKGASKIILPFGKNSTEFANGRMILDAPFSSILHSISRTL